MALPFGEWGIIFGIQFIMIFLEMFLDWIDIVLLTMPRFVPIILKVGFTTCPALLTNGPCCS